tara:strand:+ start:1230 stop:1730 length:501 start_codon:yes stop_codon:yes gene_type:complete
MSVKTRVTKEVVTLKKSDDGKTLSTGDNWSCPCMAGVIRAKKPAGHDNCDRHIAFKKWLSEHNTEKQKELRSLSDKLSAEQSNARHWETKSTEMSKEFLKYKTWYQNSEHELCTKERKIKSLENDINEFDEIIDNREREIRILYENVAYFVDKKEAKRQKRIREDS